MLVCKTTKDHVLAGSSLKHVEVLDKHTYQSTLFTPTRQNQNGFISQNIGNDFELKTTNFDSYKNTDYNTYNNNNADDNDDESRLIKRASVNPGKRAFKNLLVLSLSFMFVYTAFVSLQSVQSSIHARDGVVSMSCLYAATVLSCFLAPAIIKKLTTKWTVVIAFIVFLVFICANFYPRDFTLIPAASLLGLVNGPLWSGQATYLTTIAMNYARSREKLYDLTLTKFNGIFCSIFQMSQIWGNVLTAVSLTDNQTVRQNTVNTSQTHLLCGARDCGIPNDYRRDATVPHYVADVPSNVMHMLLSIYFGCGLMGVAMATSLLDKNECNLETTSGTCSLSSQKLFMATLRSLHDPRLQLLLPLVFFTGLEQGFVFGDFTKSYVNCALGVHNIGHIMVCFGCVNVISSFGIGFMVPHIKRFPIMVSGSFFNAGLLIVLLWWRPRVDDIPIFYVISSCLGLCDAIWQTQTITLFGILFADKQEPAFACYRMFQNIGYAVAFGYSYFLCVETKVYVMGVTLAVSLVLYSAVELKLHQSRRLTENIVSL